MTKNIIVVFLSVILGLSCSKGGSGISGTGSSTGNANVLIGVVHGCTGNDSGITICLVPEDYNPVSDNIIPDSLIARSDVEGKFSFVLSDSTSGCNLLAFSKDTVNNIIVKNVKYSNSADTVDLGILSLKSPGALKMVLPASDVDTTNGYVYIPGTISYVDISNYLQYDSVNLTLLIDGIPPASYSEVHYAKRKSSVDTSIFSDTVIVIGEADTLTLGEYKPVVIVYNSKNSGLPNDGVYTVFSDKIGTNWFGTYTGEFARINDSGWIVSDAGDYGVNSSILSIFRDADSTVWFGTHGAIFSIHEHLLTVYNVYNSPFPGGSVYSIVSDKNNKKWFSTYGNGIISYDGNVWVIYTELNSSLNSNIVYRSAVDTGNYKWFVGPKGFESYREDVGWHNYESSCLAIGIDTVSAVAISSNNTKWFGSIDGKVAKLTGSILSYIPASESYTNGATIYSMVFDNNDALWMGLSNGSVLKFDGVAWVLYTSENSNIPDGCGNIYNCSVDTRNNKWFATEKSGVVFFDNSIN